MRSIDFFFEDLSFNENQAKQEANVIFFDNREASPNP
jgi:hypothetical protein